MWLISAAEREAVLPSRFSLPTRGQRDVDPSFSFRLCVWHCLERKIPAWCSLGCSIWHAAASGCPRCLSREMVRLRWGQVHAARTARAAAPRRLCSFFIWVGGVRFLWWWLIMPIRRFAQRARFPGGSATRSDSGPVKTRVCAARRVHLRPKQAVGADLLAYLESA